MNGFSKMNLVGSTKQRSMELLHLLSLPQNPKPIDINTSSSFPKEPQSQKTKQPAILEHSHSHAPSSQLEIEDDADSDSDSDGEHQSRAFLLHRSRSVSSETAPHCRFWFYEAKGRAKIQAAAAVKRAFSMRRSSSYSSSSSSVVSDQRHCGIINGRSLTMYSPFGDDNTGDAAQSMVNSNNNNIALQTTSLRKKKKTNMSKLQQRTGKIFKACKAIFGL